MVSMVDQCAVKPSLMDTLPMGRSRSPTITIIWKPRLSLPKAITILKYRINGGGGVRIIEGGWKWFDITIIGGLE